MAPDSGMVTVELALGFLAVVVMVALVMSVVSAGLTRASVCQSVREVARTASVGEQDAVAAAGGGIGRDVQVDVVRTGRWVTARGSARVDGPLGWVGGTARCEVTTLLEQAVP